MYFADAAATVLPLHLHPRPAQPVRRRYAHPVVLRACVRCWELQSPHGLTQTSVRNSRPPKHDAERSDMCHGELKAARRRCANTAASYTPATPGFRICICTAVCSTLLPDAVFAQRSGGDRYHSRPRTGRTVPWSTTPLPPPQPHHSRPNMVWNSSTTMRGPGLCNGGHKNVECTLHPCLNPTSAHPPTGDHLAVITLKTLGRSVSRLHTHDPCLRCLWRLSCFSAWSAAHPRVQPHLEHGAGRIVDLPCETSLAQPPLLAVARTTANSAMLDPSSLNQAFGLFIGQPSSTSLSASLGLSFTRRPHITSAIGHRL
ncbi:hypothetical protein GMOD_00005252 [Pyrenophora seminiperda CCB06]|uniref:Uncharacterized protein n=1 Tax=Pyrenophora seminiperda CCB06 TaxID=1302712 RepID=A0A3M7LVC4_9PLEO|nr:hypothetical protein GMOD_00005252 [Pyrenophora seminiperda CCB06]